MTKARQGHKKNEKNHVKCEVQHLQGAAERTRIGVAEDGGVETQRPGHIAGLLDMAPSRQRKAWPHRRPIGHGPVDNERPGHIAGLLDMALSTRKGLATSQAYWT